MVTAPGAHYTSPVSQRNWANGFQTRGEDARNNNDTKLSFVAINMFVGTKVKTIDAPTVYDFTNSQRNILAEKKR